MEQPESNRHAMIAFEASLPPDIAEILDAFVGAGRVLPRTALKQAVERWSDLAPVLLAVLEAVAGGAEITERVDSILFFGIYLMAQVQERRAFPLLCAIAADRDRLDTLIGDAVTEDLSVIFARTYDGDSAPLRALIESKSASEYVRDAGIGAIAWLTVTGQIEREETARYLRDLHATLQPQGECWVWVGWQQAIAVLGFSELTPLVENAFARGLIGRDVMSLKHFREDLSAALQAADHTTVFDKNIRDDGRFDDVAALLSTWPGFQPLPAPRRAAPSPEPVAVPVRDPYRGVGRNDPCPCGSGKKYKKCCL